LAAQVDLKQNYELLFTCKTGAKVASYWSLEVSLMPLKKITKQAQLVSRDYIINMRDFALSKGVAAKTLLENSDADLELLLTPPPQVSEHLLRTMGYNLFKALPDPYEAVIEFGKGMVLSVHGSLGVAIQGATDINEVANLAQQYYQTRSNSRSILLESDGDFLCVRMPEDHSKFDYYLTLATLVSFEYVITRMLTHYTLRERCVIHQNFPEPENFPWHKIEGYELKFSEKFNQLMVPKSWLNLTINPINQELASLAKSKCDQTLQEISSQDLVNDIRQKLKNLPSQNTSLKEMADLLHVSPSTLQRRLREFDTTYKDIKLEERLITAKQLLFNNENSLEQISEQLGFSDASSFTKSFKTFSGHTPAAYRKMHATEQ